MKKVCSNTAVWVSVLMLMVPGSVLSAEDPPSAQDQAVRKVRPVTTTPVPPALHQALARSLSEAASIGTKAIPTPPTGSWGIVSEGDGGGGIFRDSDSEAEAWLGTNGYGVEGYGFAAGGFFKDSDDSGFAFVGTDDYGIWARGTFSGGYFKDLDNTGYAYVGFGEFGVFARGNGGGGIFEDIDNSGRALVGYGDRGIEAIGSEMGGFFQDTDNLGYAYVGYGDRGIHAYGNAAGGYFKDSNSSGYAWAGYGDYGMSAYGNYAGGYFEELDGDGYAYVGIDGYGIAAHGGQMGGFFADEDSSGYANVAYGHIGIRAAGDAMGGHFADLDSSGFAYVGWGHFGITAQGNGVGGHFNDLDSSSYAHVGSDTYKISGSGAVSFVQNHPYDSSSVIVYAAPEGDEVATYTRGTARLVDGEATVPLGVTFKWVTNPDIGLTAHLTPREDCNGVYLADLSTEEMVVRELQNGTSDCAFDFLVYGLRIGFEELSIVQEKEMESYIPSMAGHRELYERRPDLKSFNSLERFKDMLRVAYPNAELNLSRAQALRDAIIEFDPAVHELPQPPGFEEMPVDHLALDEDQREGVQGHKRVRAVRAGHDRRPATDHSDLSAAIPVDDEGNVYAPSFRPPSREVATLVDVSESVEPGDVLVIDRDTAGLMRRGFEGHDSGVVGVVLGPQSLALSGEEVGAGTSLHAEVAIAGVVTCNVDATYGAIWPGNLLVTSPTSGHAMRTESPLPGTIVGKALEPLEEGTGTIRVLVMLR